MLYPLIEDWAIIRETQMMYAVSDRGRIGKLVGNDEVEIIIDVDDEGRSNKKYKTVWLFGQKYYIHRLVAEYHLDHGKGRNNTEVNHIDGDHCFNLVTNLQWCTKTYNNKHRSWNKKYKFDWGNLRWTQ